MEDEVDEDENEDVEENEGENEDGGIDLSTIGKKPAPPEDEDGDEANSNAEKAEIWKVCHCHPNPCGASHLFPGAGDKGLNACGT